MKIALNVLLLLWMLMSVVVQFNDPDGPLWMVIYGYGLVMIGLAIRGTYNTPLLILGIVGYILGGFVVKPDSFANLMETNEEGRECIGLFISSGCLVIVLLQKLMQK